MSLKYGLLEIDTIRFYALAAMEGVLSCYQVQQTEDGPKLDLPPPELLANTAFAYAEAMYAKESVVLSQEVEE